MKHAAARRLAEARLEQRGAVVAEMHTRAAELATEVEARKAKRTELYRAFETFEGPGSIMLIGERSTTERMAMQAEQMHNAADMFVAHGLDCARDTMTGLAFDAGLW